VSWYKPWTWFGGGREADGPIPDKPPRRRAQPPQHPGWFDPDRFATHAGRRLSMEGLISAHDAAERGYPWRLFDIFRDRMKADAHLRALVGHRRDDVCRALEVLPGGPEEVDRASARELARRLRLARNFRAALKHHQMTFWFGFALSEVDWQIRDGLYVPVAFENLLPRRFNFTPEDLPRLRTSASIRNLEDAYGEELRAGAWWYSRRDGDRAAVAGDGFTACMWSHFKTLSMRDWLRLSDRFGIPFVYGTFETGGEDKDAADDKEIEALKEAVEKLGKDRWAVFANACEIKVAEVRANGGGPSDIHATILNACDDQISKLVAGATTLAQTSGKTGSYAQSAVHADRGFNLYQSDAADLSDSLEQYLGRAWVTYNASRFPGAAPSRFKFHLVQNTALPPRTEVFDVALNKLRLPLSAEQVRTELQLKPAEGDVLAPSPAGLPPIAADQDLIITPGGDYGI
jgi:phage gp29-like protein